MAKSTGAPASSNGHATDAATGLPDRRAGERTYDAIVIGGGHNGLVNGAYLAKNGLKTLILERRHLVGGAAITEELRPGFWFTTFSYALSLLRPDIIHDLELTKHGFMPLLMPSTFAPMENPLKAFANCLCDSGGHGFAGFLGQIPCQLMCFGVFNVQAHSTSVETILPLYQ